MIAPPEVPANAALAIGFVRRSVSGSHRLRDEFCVRDAALYHGFRLRLILFPEPDDTLNLLRILIRVLDAWAVIIPGAAHFDSDELASIAARVDVIYADTGLRHDGTPPPPPDYSESVAVETNMPARAASTAAPAAAVAAVVSMTSRLANRR